MMSSARADVLRGGPRDAFDDGTTLTIGIVGLGYVGLPTAIAFADAGHHVLGVDVDERRLRAIRTGDVDLLPGDLVRLAALDPPELTTDPTRLAVCDAVIVCVPTPVDHHLVPNLGSLRAACAAVVGAARPGQTLILTSTSYAGTTHDLLTGPLRARGFTAGHDIFVAFSPERIDPANTTVHHTSVPRVVGGVTDECARRAAAVLSQATTGVHVVSSPEAAELCKLLENSFRAVNISLANEFAEIAGALGVDPLEVVDAAATKPYGYMPFYPGPGVGGHCIPCDPHYLRWQMRARRLATPVLDAAMESIAQRPGRVVARVVETLSVRTDVSGRARVLVVGVAYKANVADVRESPAVAIIEQLRARGIAVDFYDPVAPLVRLGDGSVLETVEHLDAAAYDLVLAHTLHDRVDHEPLHKAPVVVDATYRLDELANRVLP
jgi:UDP-N-acetyl-D-glucosamine dehydrogenase